MFKHLNIHQAVRPDATTQSFIYNRKIIKYNYLKVISKTGLFT